MESFALGAQVVGMKGCEDMKVDMDRAGYFVIIPQQDKGSLRWSVIHMTTGF